MRKARLFSSAAASVLGVATLLAAPAHAQSVAAPGPAAPDAPAAAPPVSTGSSQEDIIVTATKRNERLSQIAAPISAITGAQLAKSNANSLADYITRLPGVVFNDYQPGISEVVIRGIAATTYHEQGQTTTGYYLNEVQVVEPGFPIGIPDIDTFDLDRVEVLRGPQGTLFGSSTLGGLVNYIAKVADPTRVDAAVEGLIGSTKNANRALNYAGKAMLNVPIIQDKLAVRVMALQRYDAGYIDNLGTGEKAANDFRTRGLRGSIVATPAEGTTITYLSTYQDTRLDDQTYVTSADVLTRVTQNPEAQHTSFFLNSLRLDQDVPFGTLTVLGSVDKKKNTTIFDASFYGFLSGVTTGPDAPISLGAAHANIKTIEARLASHDDGRFRWLVGTSYLHATKSSYDRDVAPGAQDYIDANPDDFGGVSGAVLAPGDRIYGYLAQSVNEDFGIFGEARYKFTDTIELTAGGRYYHTVAKGNVVNQSGYVSGSAVDLTGGANQKESGFTPKVTLSWTPAHQVLAYATFSEGYRVGGINPNAGLLPSLPVSYGSDKVYNYEAGTKFSTTDNRLTIDASVFHIDWKNIQAREFGPAPNFFSYVINAANARVTGVEFAGAVKITRQLGFSTNATYETAKLSKFLPDNFGPGYPAGTRLPGTSHWSIANNLTLDLPDAPLAPSFELAHRYLSKAPVAFGNPSTRGNYNLFDARASINVMRKVRLLGFVDNIFDKRGVLSGPFTGETAPAYSVTRPRSFGARVDWSL